MEGFDCAVAAAVYSANDDAYHVFANGFTAPADMIAQRSAEPVADQAALLVAILHMLDSSPEDAAGLITRYITHTPEWAEGSKAGGGVFLMVRNPANDYGGAVHFATPGEARQWLASFRKLTNQQKLQLFTVHRDLGKLLDGAPAVMEATVMPIGADDTHSRTARVAIDDGDSIMPLGWYRVPLPNSSPLAIMLAPAGQIYAKIRPPAAFSAGLPVLTFESRDDWQAWLGAIVAHGLPREKAYDDGV